MLPYAPAGPPTERCRWPWRTPAARDRSRCRGRVWNSVFARERIAAPAERVGEPSLRRPDRRRRGRERLPAFDAHLHGPEPPFEAVEQVAQHAEGVLRHVEARNEHGTGVCRVADGGGPPAARDLTMAGRRSMARWTFGSSADALAELGDGRLQRLQLCGEFAGRRAITAILDLEHSALRLQLRDLGVGAPAQPEPDQHGQREHRERRTDHGLRVDARNGGRRRCACRQERSCSVARGDGRGVAMCVDPDEPGNASTCGPPL